MNRRTWYQAPEDFPESDLLSPEIIELLDETETTDGEVIGANDSVQVEGGYFLRVIHITLKNTDTIYLHGILLVPNEDIDQQYSERNGHNLKSWLPCDIQELCAIIKTETGSSDIDADLRKIPMEDVERKTNIVFTNALYPRHKADNTLVCRWKWIQKDDGKKDTEFQLRRITQAESDVDYGKSQSRLLRRARPFQPHSLRKAVGYTHADICAGGGGSARAADMAGLNIAWVLDNDPNAANTLRENFGAEKVLEEDLADLAEQRGDLLRVDVLHISFVCKPHSGLNRGTNPERDAMFVALGYTLPDILRVCKPRVVTMEQVPGVLNRSADGQHFRSYIHSLTEAGYECRWKIVNFSQYSNPQPRKRVIVLASCPGQTLPSWPQPLNGPGLADLVTINDALQNMGPTDELPDYMLRHTVLSSDVQHPDPDKPLPRVISCNGGDTNIHPYEDRSFNMAELAALNGFPPWHKFPELGITALRVLIGNAVPAMPFEHFFREVVSALEETDKQLQKDEPKKGAEFIDLTGD